LTAIGRGYHPSTRVAPALRPSPSRRLQRGSVDHAAFVDRAAFVGAVLTAIGGGYHPSTRVAPALQASPSRRLQQGLVDRAAFVGRAALLERSWPRSAAVFIHPRGLHPPYDHRRQDGSNGTGWPRRFRWPRFRWSGLDRDRPRI